MLMIRLSFGKGSVTIDFYSGNIVSVKYGSEELAKEASPVFKAALRNGEGEAINIDAREGTLNALTVNGGESGFYKAEAVYGFPDGQIIKIRTEAEGEALNWNAEVRIPDGQYLEWIELPAATLKPLKGEGGEASVLFPYNEGMIVDSMADRLATLFRSCPVEYPSLGMYHVFPNMICSQFLAYLMPGYGLYVGAHDPERGFKHIDFTDSNGGIGMQIRIYPADKSGDDVSYAMEFPVVWKFFDGGWEDAAEIYREWFESALPADLVKISENDRLPGWYEDMPLVVSYPVRGIHDMDEMKPNALFPYTNGLGLIGTVERATGAEILTLLMHWEGTAPWAPPYVWPPYGGEADFDEFRDALHERGDMLGVYCSGFGYTEKSNLNDYSCAEEFEKLGLEKAMCAGLDGKVLHSRICTGQRVGYDICPASAEGDRILDEAYAPLFKAGIDYAQILDQNHGGGQYLCYSSRHGHRADG